MMQPTPHPHISSRGTYITKLILRVLQFALAIANLGLVGSLVSTGIWGMATLIVITPQVGRNPSSLLSGPRFHSRPPPELSLQS